MKANTIDVVERLRRYANPEDLKVGPLMMADAMLSAADTIERLRAELAAKVPDGYVVVPVEPTSTMIEAGRSVLDEHGCNPLTGDTEFCYSAMIAAAEGGEPQPSGSSPGFNGIF